MAGRAAPIPDGVPDSGVIAGDGSSVIVTSELPGSIPSARAASLAAVIASQIIVGLVLLKVDMMMQGN